MKKYLDIRKISILAIYLSVLVAAKYLFGLVVGFEIVTSLFIFAAMIFELPIVLLLVFSFNLIIIALYGIGTWWIMYWIIYTSIVVVTFFIRNTLQKNVFLYSIYNALWAFSIFIFYFFHDLIFFGPSFAIANLIPGMITNSMGAAINFGVSALMFWAINDFSRFYSNLTNNRWNSVNEKEGEKVKKTIKYNDTQINVEVKNNKNMYLKVGKDLKPLLIIPRGIPEQKIHEFLDESLPKINKAIDKRTKNKKYDFDSKKPFVNICGVKHKIVVIDIEENKRSKFKVTDDSLEVQLPKGKELEKEVIKFLKKQAYSLQKPIMDEWSKKMNLPYNSLKINVSKTRWGSCNTQTHNINLSVWLYLEQLEAQVYVIVHELAHIQVPDHSKNFWNLVGEYLPDYKEYSKKLKY